MLLAEKFTAVTGTIGNSGSNNASEKPLQRSLYTGSASTNDVTINFNTNTLSDLKIRFRFVGYTNSGIAKIKLDGVELGTYDTYRGSTTYDLIATFSPTDVAEGSHTLQILQDTKNASSAGYALFFTEMMIEKTVAGNDLSDRGHPGIDSWDGNGARGLLRE